MRLPEDKYGVLQRRDSHDGSTEARLGDDVMLGPGNERKEWGFLGSEFTYRACFSSSLFPGAVTRYLTSIISSNLSCHLDIVTEDEM